MPPTNHLEREAARVRRDALRRERDAQRTLIRLYAGLVGQLRDELRGLEADITAARATGRDPARLLARSARTRARLDGIRARLLEFTRYATPVLTSLQSGHAQAAVGDTLNLTLAALGPAPEGVHLEFRPPSALVAHRLIGNAADGTPLGDLLHQVAGDQSRKARDVLLRGVALGENPRTVARRFAATTGETLKRSLLIARTEGLRVHRQVTLDAYQANPAVTGWAWQCTFDTRTCPACWAMSGTTFPNTVSLNSHPGCRCVMVPRTVSWEELGFTGISDSRPEVRDGSDVFAELPPAEQRTILGPSKYDAYTQGRIGLRDLVVDTHHPRWGPGRRAASLSEALAAA